MGSEFVSGSLTIGEDEPNTALSSHVSYTEQFEKHLPFYMEMGMSYDAFWNGDCALAKYYREAQKIRQKRKNEELWLQGRYIYDALCCVAPLFRFSMGKGEVRAHPYTKEPYAFSKQEFREREKEREQKALEEMRIRFETIAANVNAGKFPKKEGSKDGGV